MSAFDSLQHTVFAACAKVFGGRATWLPSAGGELITGEMLHKDPSAKYGIGEIEIEAPECVAEYDNTYFPGLYEAMRRGGIEVVKIYSNEASFTEYYVQKATKSHDGKTITLTLNRK